MADIPIDVAYPAAEDLSLRIALGACRFRARPGDGDAWIATSMGISAIRILPVLAVCISCPTPVSSMYRRSSRAPSYLIRAKPLIVAEPPALCMKSQAFCYPQATLKLQQIYVI